MFRNTICAVVRRLLLAAPGLAVLLCGCRSAQEQRELADRNAAAIIAEKQKVAFGETEPFTVERPSDTLRRKLIEAQGLPHVSDASLGTDRLEPPSNWPEENYPARTTPPAEPWMGPDAFPLSLLEALQVGARNSRDYQLAKEEVFRSALELDLQRNNFSWIADGTASADATANLGPGGADGITASGDVGVSRLLKTGALIAGSIGIDLVKLLTGGRGSALGLFGDATIAIPLLRGAGRDVVTEPLTQAERNVVYALQGFERFKRSFAVQVASDYLGVLRQLDRAHNQEENYRNLVVLSRRTRALAASGRLPGVQVDQARQDELRARETWILAHQAYENSLDRLKESLGLPPDARVELRREELTRMAEAVRAHFPVENKAGGGIDTGAVEGADAEVALQPPDREGKGRYELPEEKALRLAFENRQDLKVTQGQVYDAQRKVVVAADALRAGLTFVGSASFGEARALTTADLGDARLDPTKGLYAAGLLLDLPLERTAERDAYREAYVDLEDAVLGLQAQEDRIKLDVRATLRRMLQTRESVRIQLEAVRLAADRVTSTNLFLEAGRAQVRDVLEAQESQVSAQNALTEAFLSYRIAELELQRDLGVLLVDATGLWTEYAADVDE